MRWYVIIFVALFGIPAQAGEFSGVLKKMKGVTLYTRCCTAKVNKCNLMGFDPRSRNAVASCDFDVYDESIGKLSEITLYVKFSFSDNGNLNNIKCSCSFPLYQKEEKMKALARNACFYFENELRKIRLSDRRSFEGEVKIGKVRLYRAGRLVTMPWLLESQCLREISLSFVAHGKTVNTALLQRRKKNNTKTFWVKCNLGSRVCMQARAEMIGKSWSWNVCRVCRKGEEAIILTCP